MIDTTMREAPPDFHNSRRVRPRTLGFHKLEIHQPILAHVPLFLELPVVVVTLLFALGQAHGERWGEKYNSHDSYYHHSFRTRSKAKGYIDKAGRLVIPAQFEFA
jgi:hypothetical protein